MTIAPPYCGFGRGLERANDFAGDGTGHGRAAAMHVLDGFEQFAGRQPLEHVPAGPGGQCLEDLVGVLIDRQHHDLDLRHQSFEAPRAFDAADATHMDVHQHHVGLVFGQMFQRRLAAVIYAHTPKTGRSIHKGGDGLAQLFLVIHNGYSNHGVSVTFWFSSFTKGRTN